MFLYIFDGPIAFDGWKGEGITFKLSRKEASISFKGTIGIYGINCQHHAKAKGTFKGNSYACKEKHDMNHVVTVKRIDLNQSLHLYMCIHVHVCFSVY